MRARCRRGNTGPKPGWGARLGALLLLACGSDEDGGRAFSPVGDDVEREGWVDTAHPLADFRGDEPRLEVHDLGPWGCAELALRDDTAHCAQGRAGYVAVPLGEP